MPYTTPALRGVILAIDNMDTQCKFYEQLFGPLKFRDGDQWAVLDAGGATISFAGPREQTGHPVALSAKVTDVAAAVEAAVAAGGVQVSPPVQGAHEIRASVADPAGHLIVFYSGLATPAAESGGAS